MRIFRDTFTASELAVVHRGRELAANSRLARSSTVIWPRELTEGVAAAVSIVDAGLAVHNAVYAMLRRTVPELAAYEVQAQFCSWPRGSAINPHNDLRYRFAATVYLNTEWRWAWGGRFCWQDAAGATQDYVPTHNTMIVNDQNLRHWVTEIVVDQPRYTLQLWARG